MSAGDVATFLVPLTAPTGLNAIAGDAKIHLTWNPSANAHGYHIKRAETSSGPYLTIATNITRLTYIDTNVFNGRTCYYVVSAVNNIGISYDSGEISARPVSTKQSH